jgi:hypothetical protein
MATSKKGSRPSTRPSKKATDKASATIRDYRLSGPQVELEASYWNLCLVPCPVTFDQLTSVTEDPDNPHFFPPYPTDPVITEQEFRELLI